MAYPIYTNDPVADWEDYQEELDEEERRFIEASPKCECCGRPVGEADNVKAYYLFGWFCADCVSNARTDIPDMR